MISKEIFHMTDTYVLDIVNPVNALRVLMFVLAIDAENAPGVQTECAAKSREGSDPGQSLLGKAE